MSQTPLEEIRMLAEYVRDIEQMFPGETLPERAALRVLEWLDEEV